MDTYKILTEGMVFKKAKEQPSEENKIRYSSFLKGTHHSDSAKKKAEYKYKKALRNQRKNNKSGK